MKEIGSQNERERCENGDEVYIRPAAEPVDRPIDWCAQSRGRSTVRSTGVHKCTQNSAQDSSVDRSIDRLPERPTAHRPTDMMRLSVEHGRPTGRPDASVCRPPGRPTGVSMRGSVSPFWILTLFLNCRRIQLGFPKFLGIFGNK